LLDTIVLGPVTSVTSQQGVHDRAKLFASWKPGSKEKEEGTKVPIPATRAYSILLIT
jgi:hypothetical protein